MGTEVCFGRGCAALLAALLLSFTATPPLAAQTPWWQPTEIRAGLVAHDVKPISSATEPGAAFSGALLWQPLLASGDGKLALRPALGVSASLSGDTSYGYLDLVLDYRPVEPWFFDAGLGFAVHDGYTSAPPRDRRNLGSRGLFHVSAEVGAHLTDHFGLAVYFDHLSNARLFSRTNQGLETIGLRGIWSF